MNPAPRCKPKIRYRNELDARIALARMVRRGTGQLRVYRCPECGGGWHTTSQPRRREQ